MKIKKTFIDPLKTKIGILIEVLKNPKMIIANLIYKLYKYDKNKLPYPLFLYVLSQYGGWAGLGIYIPIRQYQWNIRIRKIQKFFIQIFLPIILFILLSIGFKQKSDNFFFGFVQNVFSDIFLIILIIYLIPKILNKPKKYRIMINYKKIYSENQEYSIDLILSLLNTGEEIFKPHEFFWEVYIPFEFLRIDEITLINGEFEKSKVINIPMWKFYGENTKSLFLKQELNLVKMRVPINILYGSVFGPPKIYYKFFTINGNIPEFENITLDFEGAGILVDEYPNLGELPIIDWYNPENMNINNLG